MSVHRFGHSQASSSFDKDYFDLKLKQLCSKLPAHFDLEALSEKILKSIDQQQINTDVKSYLDDLSLQLQKSRHSDNANLENRLDTLSREIEKTVSNKILDSITRCVDENTSSTKSYLDLLSKEIENISTNKVDKAYLNERLQLISDKIKASVTEVGDKNVLNKVDKTFLNSKLEKLGKDIESVINKESVDKKLREFETKLFTIIDKEVIKKDLFEQRLIEMANVIKGNILEGINQFVARDELNNYLTKSYMKDWWEKNKNGLMDQLVNHGTISTQDLEGRLQKYTNEISKHITEDPEIAKYIDNRIQYMCWVLTGRYIEVGYNYDWEEIKSHNLSAEHVKQDYRNKMGLRNPYEKKSE